MSFSISQLGNPISGVLYCRSRPPMLNAIFLNVRLQREKYGFQASLSYRRPHFGLLEDLLKVAYENNTSFAEY